MRPEHLPDCESVPRREWLPGAAILGDGHAHGGLEIGPQVLLPFLLAGRAQALVAASTKGRALFAEGLSSSFEAYLETRAGRAGLDEDGDVPDGDQTANEASSELDWYLCHLDRALPKSGDVCCAHPKIRATAERAVALWRAGEKVLIFCHYRATGRALRQHISSLLHQDILTLAQAKLPGRALVEVEAILDDLRGRFFDEAGLRTRVDDWLATLVTPFALSDEEQPRVIEVVRRFLRTPSFLARYFPLDASDRVAAFIREIDVQGSEGPLAERIADFCRFLVERCIPTERQEFLDALHAVHTGAHVGKDVRSVFDPAERHADDDGATLLPNVRLANGEVRAETRRRLLLTFNTPFFPEILIASSVLAEGVDLHLHCRHVIHHDLCWNPSTLEQRSGRVDRIGCRAERVRQSIRLFMPYVAATQDEKMYRVVRDRQRWFQIVMGEKYETDESSTERQAKRIPLPLAVQRQLVMRLHT